MHFDAGNAGEVLRQVLEAITHNTTFPLVIDELRTLRVVHTNHSESESRIMTQDAETGEFIILHIPRDPNQRARADVGHIQSA